MSASSCGTRNQIMDAAEQLFGDHGYARVTVSEVCRASGLPVGSVYHHFASKAGLLEAVLHRGATEFFGALPAADLTTGDPLAGLAAYYAVASELIGKRLALFRLFASLRLHGTGADDTTAVVGEQEDRAISRVADVVAPVARTFGVPDPNGCAQELAELTIAFTSGLVVCAPGLAIDVEVGLGHLHRLVITVLRDRSTRAAS